MNLLALKSLVSDEDMSIKTEAETDKSERVEDVFVDRSDSPRLMRVRSATPRGNAHKKPVSPDYAFKKVQLTNVLLKVEGLFG